MEFLIIHKYLKNIEFDKSEFNDTLPNQIAWWLEETCFAWFSEKVKASVFSLGQL